MDDQQRHGEQDVAEVLPGREPRVRGYDDTLRTGPYQFSEPYTRPDWVEFFKFQNGMLVWYVDHSQEDNNTSQHPGAGLSLPVDARPAKFTYPDGTAPSNRRQPLDATFGLRGQRRRPACTSRSLAGKGQSQSIQTLEACSPGGAGIATFDDTDPLTPTGRAPTRRTASRSRARA